ncbi:MAG: SRPBCC family protein [Chloroflexota bacterium]|nr:SRPBCC family protein [Chloroflexota bacterium]
MPNIRVETRRPIPYDSDAVYRCLADFERGQPRLLPEAVRDYEVQAGGIGEGTIVSCAMTIHGRERQFLFRIAEPIWTRTITAYDHDSHLTLTWFLRAEGPTSEVEIEAYWTEPESTFGFLKVWWASFVIRRLLNAMLDRIPHVIDELGYDQPPNAEARE